MAIHRSAYSLSSEGHLIPETGAGNRWEFDCPTCKNGTLVFCKGYAKMKCIDCKEVHTVERLIELHVLPNRKAKAA